MKKLKNFINKKYFFIFIGIILVYFILINIFVAFLKIDNAFNSVEEMNNMNGITKIGVSENVQVSVVKNKFYGQIVEISSSDSKESNLFLFNIIKIPLFIKNI